MNTFLRIKIQRNMPVDQHMKDVIANLRFDVNSHNLDELFELNFFNDYYKMLFTDTWGAQTFMMNRYIKDASSVLALIFEVYGNNFE